MEPARLALYRKYWEQPMLDLWTIPHTLLGFLISYAVLRFRVNLWLGFVLTCAAATLWELYEKTSGISAPEYFSNHFSDILVALIGYAAGVLVFMGKPAEYQRRWFYIGLAVFTVFTATGLTWSYLAQRM